MKWLKKQGIVFWFFFALFASTVVGGALIFIPVLRTQGQLDFSGPPDMQVTMTVEPASVQKGGAVTFRVNHENIGESPAGSTALQISIPQGITINNIAPGSPACRDNNGTVNCGLGTRSPGATGSVVIEGTVSDSASGASAAVTVGPTRDLKKEETAKGNNTATASVTVQ